MGYIAHHAVIVVISAHAWSTDEYYRKPLREEGYGVTEESFNTWRKGLPEQFQRIILGPVTTPANGDYVITMLPDGSKEGWGISDEGDRIRGELIDMFKWAYSPEDLTDSPFDVAEMRFGGDDNDCLWIEDRHLTPDRPGFK